MMSLNATLHLSISRLTLHYGCYRVGSWWRTPTFGFGGKICLDYSRPQRRNLRRFANGQKAETSLLFRAVMAVTAAKRRVAKTSPSKKTLIKAVLAVATIATIHLLAIAMIIAIAMAMTTVNG